MNTTIDSFVNAIACDLEEGGFRQVSGTTLRRTLTEAVSAALPLLQGLTEDPSFDVESMLVACVPGGNVVDPQLVADNIRAWCADPKALRKPGGTGWSGWATQYPGKMPKLCGAREIAELNHYPEQGQRLIFLSEQPTHGTALGRFRKPVEQAIKLLAVAPWHHEDVRLLRELLARIDRQPVDERAFDQAIAQRDRYHEVADDLADHIARITGAEIGEHSSDNCPWQNATHAADEYKTAHAADQGDLHAVLVEVATERARQEAKWGQQNHVDWTQTTATSDLAGVWPGGAGPHFKWITEYKAAGKEGHTLGYFDILMEEVAEAHDEARNGNVSALREEVIQVAAVAVAWAECIDRRLGQNGSPRDVVPAAVS